MSEKFSPPATIANPDPRAATAGDAIAPVLPIPGDTQQERLHAMHEMLFARNPDGICFSDRQGNISFNQAGLAMMQVDKAKDDISGMEQWAQAYGVFLPDGKTPHPNDTMPIVRALINRETTREYEVIIKTPAHPQGRWLSCSAAPLPDMAALCVFRDITDRKRLEADLAQRNEELAVQLRENNSLIERLRLAVDELSTPVLELADDILALPVVGIVDTVRSTRMMEKVLAEVVARRCRAVIIDVTGVDVIDTSTADRFIRIARAIELLGADCVISGVQPAVAQTLTDLGVSFRGLAMQRNLKRALDVCVARLQNSRRVNTQ